MTRTDADIQRGLAGVLLSHPPGERHEGNSELPFCEVNAVMGRLPIGVVNLLYAHRAPQGQSLRETHRPFDVIAALAWRSVASGYSPYRASATCAGPAHSTPRPRRRPMRTFACSMRWASRVPL